MNILQLTDYTADQLRQAQAQSPALERYLTLLKTEGQAAEAQLRLKRHNSWARAVLATIFNTAGPREICQFWSEQSDQLLKQAWQMAQCHERPLALLALGKLGASELNLSSDVDVLVVSDNAPDETILQLVKKFRQILSEVSDFGFCLRVDFDLRPGGRFGPLVSSMEQMQDYYWSQGETWERLALVRLRQICGHSSTLLRATELAHKFCYRKFLDFTLFAELKELRSKIQSHLGQNDQERIHLKLGVGGIRDIELFVHALQVIHGGKDLTLRSPSTEEALQTILKKNILPKELGEFLLKSYWELRQWENKVQLVNDEQTHWLHLSGLNSTDIRQLQNTMALVDSSVSELLGKVDKNVQGLPQAEADQLQWLKDKGFEMASLSELWSDLINATALSHKRDRDERIRQDFLFRFINEIATQPGDKTMALRLLLDLTKSIRAKATFFALLVAEPLLLRDMAKLFCQSPYLGGMIASRPELLDSFIFKSQGDWPQDTESLLEALVERRLLAELTAANQYLGDLDVNKLVQNLSWTADEVVSALLNHFRQEFPQSQVSILALGKWGGNELGLRSDLDMVFLTPESPSESDLRLAKRMTSQLTLQHRGGQIYAVDLRLRPSGQAGPLITRQSQLEDYLGQSAPAWLRQSYLRARPLSAYQLNLSPMLLRGLSAEDKIELLAIREKLIQKTINPGQIDIKLTKGGLTDIELAIQTSVLDLKQASVPTNSHMQIRWLEENSPAWQQRGAQLSQNYYRLRQLEQTLQLVSTHAGSIIPLDSPLTEQLASHIKLTSPQLKTMLTELLQQNQVLIKQLDPLFRNS